MFFLLASFSFHCNFSFAYHQYKNNIYWRKEPPLLFLNYVFSNFFELERYFRPKMYFWCIIAYSFWKKLKAELYFPEEEDNAKVCFHSNKTNTITIHHRLSHDYWWVGYTETNNKSTLVLVLQTIDLELLIFGFVEGLDKITTRSENFRFWYCKTVTDLAQFHSPNDYYFSHWVFIQFSH